MRLNKAFEELTPLKKIIEDVLANIGDVDYERDDKEESFLFIHYCGIISDLKYAIECMDYINRPVVKTSYVTVKNSKLYIDNMEIIVGDSIEFLINQEWQRADIFRANGKYIADFLGLDFKNDNILARIRITKEEAIKRTSEENKQ